MTTREYLEQIKAYDKSIEVKEDEFARIWGKATSTTSPIDKEPGGGGITDKVGNNAAKIADKALREEIDRLKAERQERVDLIKTLKNPLHLAVLYKHYVMHKTLVVIAEEENYSYQYIVEVHNRVVKRLKI